MWHVDEGTLHAYLDERERGEAAGALDPELRARVTSHLAVCDVCSAQLRLAERHRSMAADILLAASPAIETPPFEPYTRIAQVAGALEARRPPRACGQPAWRWFRWGRRREVLAARRGRGGLRARIRPVCPGAQCRWPGREPGPGWRRRGSSAGRSGQVPPDGRAVAGCATAYALSHTEMRAPAAAAATPALERDKVHRTSRRPAAGGRRMAQPGRVDRLHAGGWSEPGAGGVRTARPSEQPAAGVRPATQNSRKPRPVPIEAQRRNSRGREPTARPRTSRKSRGSTGEVPARPRPDRAAALRSSHSRTTPAVPATRHCASIAGGAGYPGTRTSRGNP
jgi:hypothetical protein